MNYNNNILVLVESINPNHGSGTKGRLALITNLVAIGCNVTVLHYTQKEIHIPNTNSILVKEAKGILYLLSRVQRLLNRYFKLHIGRRVEQVFGFSFTFFNDSRSMAKAIKAYSPKDFDQIWTLSKGNNYRSHKAVLLSPEWHPKWYAYIHDPYPQQLYPRPYNFVPPGYKQKRRFFRQVTFKAKHTVFPSLLLKEWMQSYYTAITDKNIIIPHQLDGKTPEKHQLPDYFNTIKFNLLHAGNLLDLRDPEPIIKAYQLFLKNTPEAATQAQLSFIGDTGRFKPYLMAAAKNTPSLYVSDGYVDYEVTRAMQQHATANIILEAKSEISPFLPGKFPHCVAADKPIILIGPYYSECRRLLGDNYNYLHEFDDVNRLANSFTELFNRWCEKETLLLNREDLSQYLGMTHLGSLFK